MGQERHIELQLRKPEGKGPLARFSCWWEG